MSNLIVMHDKFALMLFERHVAVYNHAVREYRFDPKSKWKLDFAWPRLKLAVHINMFGCENEKTNRAVEMGWQVFRYSSRQLGSIRGVEGAVDQVSEYIFERMEREL